MGANLSDHAERVGPPVLSVLLPCYNAEAYLRLAVESVLNQTFRDFELIAFDDGSTDRTLEILREFEAVDSRVRVLTRENRGLVATLNESIAVARGRLLARMDADDICEPERFQLQVDAMNRNPRLGCVGGMVRMMDEEGNLLTTLRFEQQNEGVQKFLIEGRCPLCHPACMLRADAVAEVGVYRPGLAEDIDLFLRIGERWELANVPETVLRYRFHASSMARTQREEMEQRHLSVVNERRQKRGFDPLERLPGVGDDATEGKRLTKFAWWALRSDQQGLALRYSMKALFAGGEKSTILRLNACIARDTVKSMFGRTSTESSGRSE